jgi:hypothetical protein
MGRPVTPSVLESPDLPFLNIRRAELTLRPDHVADLAGIARWIARLGRERAPTTSENRRHFLIPAGQLRTTLIDEGRPEPSMGVVTRNREPSPVTS